MRSLVLFGLQQKKRTKIVNKQTNNISFESVIVLVNCSAVAAVAAPRSKYSMCFIKLYAFNKLNNAYRIISLNVCFFYFFFYRICSMRNIIRVEGNTHKYCIIDSIKLKKTTGELHGVSCTVATIETTTARARVDMNTLAFKCDSAAKSFLWQINKIHYHQY